MGVLVGMPPAVPPWLSASASCRCSWLSWIVGSPWELVGAMAGRSLCCVCKTHLYAVAWLTTHMRIALFESRLSGESLEVR